MYQLQPLHQPIRSNRHNSPPIIQTKLKIGKPGDKYEQEADAVASQVMKMSEGESLRMQPMEEEEEMMQPKLRMQAEEEEEPIQMMCDDCRGESMIQQQPMEEEEELLQPKSQQNTQSNIASQHIQTQLSNSEGSGSSLDSQTLSFMGNRFGTDFSNVRIHNDSKSVGMNRELNAQAFTFGNNIYFNQGKYNPKSNSGKQLLAHELTHVVQQGAGIQPMIQKNGDGESSETAEESSGGSNQFAQLIAGVVRDQLSDSSLPGHLSSLGTALQGLALESTTEGSEQAVASPERLAALGIPAAFEATSREIIASPGFRQLRQRIIGIIGSSDEAAIIAALAAALALVLADVSVSASPSTDVTDEISVGGSFDFGSIQSLQFDHISAYAQYARDYFQTRLGGRVSRDEETGDFAGSGTGEVRIGNDVSHIFGRVTLDHEGQITLAGRLSAGTTFGGSDRLIFTTDVTHSFASGETIIQPGVSGRFSFGSDQSIRLGSQLVLSSDSGLTGVTGYLEYRRDQIRLRIEGSMTGLAEESGIMPGGNMQVQGTITIPLF